MKYTKSGGQTGAGPAEWFTGTVQIDGIRNPDDQTAIGCAHVRFSPGARTAWHHHPKGQTLYVTDGIGLVATRDGVVQEIRPGDVVYIELPEAGTDVSGGEPFGSIEAVKAVSDLFAPVSGVVKEANDALADSPELVNNSPYGDGWMIVVEVADASQLDALLSAEDYEKLIASEA